MGCETRHGQGLRPDTSLGFSEGRYDLGVAAIEQLSSGKMGDGPDQWRG